MKRLTINQIAKANLKQNRRAYLSMSIGVFVAIFLVTSLCLSVQGVYARRAEDRADRYGRMDMFTVNTHYMTDEEMIETGFFNAAIGHVYVTAEVPDTTIALGYYDDTALPLINRRALEGRMPEAPGEIAVEQSALDRLRLESAVGDTVTLTVTPPDGLPEERSYTIVGLLNEQSAYLDVSRMMGVGSGSGYWPSIVTCPEEPGFTTGNVSVHRLLTLRPMVTKYQVMSAFEWNGPYEIQTLWTVADKYDGTGPTGDSYYFSPAYRLNLLVEDVTVPLICMLGAALLIAVCAGISGAMESQLARKTEEIGLLRAVGATKRQIRRIFGRETWLVALTVSPAAMGLACLFVWALSLLAPSYLLFRPSLWVLLPVVALVTLTIFLASSLPLRRASRTMPMSVLRDTAILRKARRIKSRKRFKVPALVSRRQLTLHPTRLIGSVLLVAVMLFITFFGTMVAGADVSSYMNDDPAFVLSGRSNSIIYYTFSFADQIVPGTLYASDLQQIASLPLVAKVLPHRSLTVCFEADVLSDYYSFPYAWGDINKHLFADDLRALFTEQEESWEERFAALDETGTYPYAANISEQVYWDHRAAQKALGTSKPLVKIQLVVLQNDFKDLEPFIDLGKIDLEAINAGREVIAYAPDYYVYDAEFTANSMGSSMGFRTTSYYEGDGCTVHIANDVLLDGMTLPIAQFYETNHDRFGLRDGTQEEFDAFYETTNIRRANVTVGGVIRKDNFRGQLYDRPHDACIITTEEGLRNMGLNYDKMSSVAIYLSGTPDQETEDWLESRISSIAARGSMTVRNNLAARREREAEKRSVMLVLACIAVVFFAAAAGLICGNVSRRIRADSRMIGTLRAVGADDRALIACYSGSIFISIGLGVVVTALIVGALTSTGFFGSPAQTNYLPAAVCCVALAALLLGCCLWVLRLRVKDVIRKSIVENIKEL